MKNLIMPIILLFLIPAAFAQKILKAEKVTDYSIHVFGDKFEGVIFTEKYNGGSEVQKMNSKFTPTYNDINVLEKLLIYNLDTIKNESPYLNESQLFIKIHLKKYIRQYFGYLNSKGEKVIYINCFWYEPRRKIQLDWLKHNMWVMDGGKYYWSIKINLITHKSFDFDINGEA